MTTRPRLRCIVLGLAHALLIAGAFPPYSQGWLALFAVVPLLLVARNPILSAFRAGGWTALGMLPFWAWTHWWVGSVSIAGVYPLVLYLTLCSWLAVSLLVLAARSGVNPAIGLPIAWVGAEAVRAQVIWTGYPWYLLGHPLIEGPTAPLAWTAWLGGVPLVSLLTCGVGTWFVFRRSIGRPTMILAGLITAGWIGGGAWWWLGPDPVASFRIGVVQPVVPQDNRLDWDTRQRVTDALALRRLTLETAEADADLIVWPEGLVPGWTLDPVSLAHERERGVVWRIDPRTPAEAEALAGFPDIIPATLVVDDMLALQRSIGIPMVVGATAMDNLNIVRAESGGMNYSNDALYNSAFLIEHGRVSDVWYDKLHLTPFGEVMPYISYIQWLEEKMLAIGASGMEFLVHPGRSAKTLRVTGESGDAVGLATPICFEATMPGVCRKLVKKAGEDDTPVVMLNLTNDGWFGGSAAGRMSHLLCARWRCVELGIPMARSANTGVSGVIDRKGRITILDPWEEGTLTAGVAPGFATTPFAVAVGEAPGWIAIVGAVALGLLGRRRSSGEPSDNAEGTVQG